MTAEQQAPVMTVQFDGIQRSLSEDSIGAESVTSSGGQRPKSPGGRLGSFFGWKGSPQKGEVDQSPTTTFSDRSLSPMPSPRLVKSLPMNGHTAPARLTPPGLDIQKANSAGQYFDNPETPLLLGNDGANIHVKELERELSHISQELANSIRREMELEDELERFRAEYPMAPPSELGRRNSDYFSDSGASSTRFPITDVDAKVEQLEGQLRRIEQDKANLQMDVASRIQTELGRRRDLEELVRHLEDQLEKRSAEGDESSRVEQLETSLDETRKRLGQEKESKQSFEELYTATREELEHYRNERDNLRDEVVPQLRARIEGLEAQAADTQALMYENTRIQQEHGASRGLQHARMGSLANSIEEDGDRISALGGARTSASRASSLVKAPGVRRGNSVKERAEGGRQRSGSGSAQNGDAFKEIEDQRDALHKALQLLIRRYDRSQREHTRAIKKISATNTAAEHAMAARKSPFSREVAFLKEEVTTLRKRTEDALEQKWQYEKGLSGLKMDLDRAEQETRGLRILLQDNDAGSSGFNFSGSEHGEADSTDAKLKLSISTAEQERDQVRQVAQEYRQRASQATGDAAAQLLESAKRMDDLADQLENQVQSHVQLRDRLSQAVAKGEREQRESTRQIEDMQKRLAGMEDSVLAAQQHSENTLADHDAEIRRIEDATSPRLHRLNLDFLVPPGAAGAQPTMPVAPAGSSSPNLMLKKSPKLGAKLSDASLLEASRTQMLERKVKELEGLLKEAEDDMQMVVQRVNRSQLEVNELQMERDQNLAQMRKLQALVGEERKKAESLMR
jgi:chromosome segregation ATPase